MARFQVGVFVGSLAKASINKTLAKALQRVAPPQLAFTDIPIGDLPLYSYDYDADYPPVARRFKQAIASCDALLFVTPEYNRAIPGALKNAIDWGSRPYGQNVFAHKPSAIVGASPGSIGTAVAQAGLRSILAYLNSPLFNETEAYIQFKSGHFEPDGRIRDASTETFLRDYMSQFEVFIERVLTVLPRTGNAPPVT